MSAISFVPLVISELRLHIETVLLLHTEIAAAEVANDANANNEDFVHAATVSSKLVSLLTAMKNQFIGRWGSGVAGTVFNPVIVRGARRVRVGIPKLAIWAEACDPRTKELTSIPEEEHEAIWMSIKNEMIKEHDKQQQLAADRQSTTLAIVEPQAIVLPASLVAGAAVGEDVVPTFNLFRQLTTNVPTADATDVTGFDIAESELLRYQMSKKMEHMGDPLKWWSFHCLQFPLLSALARRVLCIPATSASSERIFSEAGLVVSKKRTNLRSDNVKELIFLKHNMPIADEWVAAASAKPSKRSFDNI